MIIQTPTSTAVVEALHNVPAINAVTNAHIRDVVGNKTDYPKTTADTTYSLTAYIKGLVIMHVVPVADAIADVFMRDIVGNKADAAQTTVGTTRSIIAYVKGILNRLVTLQGADSDTLETLSDQIDLLSGGTPTYFISDDLLHSNDAEVSGNDLAYAKKKTISVAVYDGTYRIKFDLRSDVSSGTVYGQIYKNGVALGTEQSTTSLTYVTFSEDLAFVRGDLIELWVKTHASGCDFYIRNFRIYGYIRYGFNNE